jgi:hypothetical protein
VAAAEVLLRHGGFGGGPANPSLGPWTTRVDLASYDALLGKTYSEIGTEPEHAQVPGPAQLLALPGPFNSAFQMVESAIAGRDGPGRAKRSSTASTRRFTGLSVS